MTNRKYKTKNKDISITDERRLANWRKYYYKHHQHHLDRNKKYYLDRMLQWYDWFESIGNACCEICGFDEHPRALDFHHINPEEKLFGIGKFINGRQCNEENKKLLLDEIKECRILCANCHRIEHFINIYE